MSTPEGKVKVWLDKQIKIHFPGAYVYKAPGGMFGVAGTPDYFILFHGIFIAIEVKAEGNKPTAIQAKRLNDIKMAGGIAATMIGRDFVKLSLIIKAVQERLNGQSNSPV